MTIKMMIRILIAMMMIMTTLVTIIMMMLMSFYLVPAVCCANESKRFSKLDMNLLHKDDLIRIEDLFRNTNICR